MLFLLNVTNRLEFSYVCIGLYILRLKIQFCSFYEMVFNISAIILYDVCLKENYFLYTFKLYRLSEVSKSWTS